VLHVPDLHLAVERAHRQVTATLTPRDRGDLVNIAEVDELIDTAGVGVPDVDTLAESHCQLVRLAPVHQVQVEVITQVGRIKYTEGLLGNLPDPVDQVVIALAATTNAAEYVVRVSEGVE